MKKSEGNFFKEAKAALLQGRGHAAMSIERRMINSYVKLPDYNVGYLMPDINANLRNMMNHIKNHLLSITVLLCCSVVVHAQADTLDVNVKLPSHPRILLPAGSEESIKANIQSSEGWKKIHNVIINECDGFLGQPVSQRIKVGRRLLGVSRECLRRIFFLSYAWRITYNDKYLKRAESEMLGVAAFDDWNPSHFLDVGEMTMAMSIGYDWLYNGLSVQSKDSIKHAILTKGIEPSFDPKSNGWLTWTNNWNQVCNAGISYGAIATFEDHPALSVTVINRAVRVIDLPMKQEYAPDGAYPEGYSYWGYGTSFNVMLIGALEKLFGKDFGLSQKPGFLKTPVYMENMTGATGSAYNYSDSGPEWEPQPAMFWFAQKLKDPSLLFIEGKQIAGNKIAALKKERLLPACMVWGVGAKLEKIKAPAGNMYVGQGENPVALMRTSWTDSNAVYMGIKTGPPNASHGHMDIGSFIMEADGVRWAMDFGMQDYESMESKKVDLWNYKQNSQRWQVFRYNNLSHNTLAVNDGLQNANGKAVITAWSDNPLFMSAQTDLSDMYKDSLVAAKRGIAIINKAYSVVRDELETAGKAVTVQWTMLTAASVQVIDKNKAELTMNGKKLLLTVTEPSNVDVVTWPTTPLHDYDAPNSGTTFVGFQLKLPANTKQAVTVMLVPGEAEGKVKGKIKPLNEWPTQR